MGWACVVVEAGNKSSPRAFVKFGEHPIGQSLERPADTVLTGKRQCQPGGKQGAENQRAQDARKHVARVDKRGSRPAGGNAAAEGALGEGFGKGQ